MLFISLEKMSVLVRLGSSGIVLIVLVRAVINDDKWIQGEFLSTVQERGAAIIKARGLSSAASAANAAIDHVRDWIIGTPKGTFVSMAVPSDGSYGIPTGIIYSFPVTCRDGRYTIVSWTTSILLLNAFQVKGLAIDEFSRKKMDATAKELVEEKIQAFSD
jgi:malate dehydrogenase